MKEVIVCSKLECKQRMHLDCLRYSADIVV